MKYFAFFILFLVQITAFGQTKVATDSYEFRFIKSKIGNQLNYGFAVKTPKQTTDKFQVRLKMQTLSKDREAFDPNKFYLVIDELKYQVRPIDVRYNYGVGMIYVAFGYLSPSPIIKDINVSKYILDYDPRTPDTFYDYVIDGYENIAPCINFGTKKNERLIFPYYKTQELRSCKLDIYFSIPKDVKEAKIYYGSTLIKAVPIQEKTRG